jgi:glutathione S-transferase
MHSGFLHIREEMPFNCRASISGLAFSEGALEDVARTKAIWRDCREKYGANGPWLFGEFTIADIMFAPVALRFITYGVSLGPVEQAYTDAIQAHPAVREWREGALQEAELIPQYERGL